MFASISAKELKRSMLEPLLKDHRPALMPSAVADELEQGSFPQRQRSDRARLEILVLAYAADVDRALALGPTSVKRY